MVKGNKSKRGCKHIGLMYTLIDSVSTSSYVLSIISVDTMAAWPVTLLLI